MPSGILNGIRNVHPMFRGYQQHDTQEFLRCFMDQLHEELKEQIPPPPEILLKPQAGMSSETSGNANRLMLNPTFADQIDDDRSQCSSPSQSLSEAEYETCDSGVSEQSSLSDETPATATFTHRHSPASVRYSRASSPSSSGCSASTANNTYQRNKPFASHRTASTSSMHSTSSVEPAARPATHRSIISDVFDGKLLSSVQCLTCDRVSTREETFQDLSLPIPGKDHLPAIHNSPGMSPSHMMTPPMLPTSMQGNPAGGSCSDAVSKSYFVPVETYINGMCFVVWL